MAEVYRFRSTEKLLCRRELEDQYIYFAKPNELNDPMEGLRDLVWHGDTIVWKNLFKHYLYCLQLFYAKIHFTVDSQRLNGDDIQVTGLCELPLTNKGACPESDRFLDIAFSRAVIDDLVGRIADRKLRRDEVSLYLKIVHAHSLPVLDEVYAQRPLSTGTHQNKAMPWQSVTSALDQLKEEHSDALLRAGNEITDDIHFRSRLTRTASCTNFELNWDFLLYDFPQIYLRRLEVLLYPDWYVACFMRDYRNSSTWGHYGDSHRGVCLIFNTTSFQRTESLGLRQIVGHSFSKGISKERWESVPMPFHDIQYGERPEEIDFFRSMGAVSRPELKKIWYGDDSGNLSMCSSDVSEYTDTWRERYWSRFRPDITKKTNDWKHEQETRLILHSMLDNFDERRKRKCTYPFESLKGTIFGINTPESDKIEIVRILTKKSEESGRSDLEFHQAYYRPENGTIGRRRIHL